MCPQAVGLIQKSCEENNIICSTISIIDQITKRLKIKRYLSVPYALGYPLGQTKNLMNRKENIKKLLNLAIN